MTQVLSSSSSCCSPGWGLCCALSQLPLALWALVRAWPHQAPGLPLVSGDVRLSTLSCHCCPRAASAAAWLNNSSNLVYSSWLLVALKAPPPPSPRSSCPGLNPLSNLATGRLLQAWAMCIGHELFSHLAGARVDIGAGGESGPCSSSHLGPCGRRMWETEISPSEPKPRSCWIQSHLPGCWPRGAMCFGKRSPGLKHRDLHCQSSGLWADLPGVYPSAKGNDVFCQKGQEQSSGVRQPSCKS